MTKFYEMSQKMRFKTFKDLARLYGSTEQEKALHERISSLSGHSGKQSKEDIRKGEGNAENKPSGREPERGGESGA